MEFNKLSIQVLKYLHKLAQSIFRFLTDSEELDGDSME